LLVGNPNVGKSVIFSYLTGKYVTVSNYPGTTVEVSRGKLRYGGHDLQFARLGRSVDGLWRGRFTDVAGRLSVVKADPGAAQRVYL
jgi:ribosome-binding ATPase YchF (GTP1/OBG family)